MRKILPLVTVALFLSAVPVAAETADELANTIAALNWQVGQGEHHLTNGNAVVRTSERQLILIGHDASKFFNLTQGKSEDIDAVTVTATGPEHDTAVYYRYVNLGHLTMDDWDEIIDPDRILAQIKAGTAADNARRPAALGKLFVDDWAEKPFLDRDKAIVFWAIRGHDSSGGRILNANAIKLGKSGATTIVWVGDPDQFVSASETLAPAIAAYQYDTGSRYADFRPGVDTVAAIGVGALAFKMLTGSSAKKGAGLAATGLLAIVLAFAKKLWLLIFLPVALAWRRVKAWLSRKSP